MAERVPVRVAAPWPAVVRQPCVQAPASAPGCRHEARRAPTSRPRTGCRPARSPAASLLDAAGAHHDLVGHGRPRPRPCGMVAPGGGHAGRGSRHGNAVRHRGWTGSSKRKSLLRTTESAIAAALATGKLGVACAAAGASCSRAARVDLADDRLVDTEFPAESRCRRRSCGLGEQTGTHGTAARAATSRCAGHRCGYRTAAGSSPDDAQQRGSRPRPKTTLTVGNGQVHQWMMRLCLSTGQEFRVATGESLGLA